MSMRYFTLLAVALLAACASESEQSTSGSPLVEGDLNGDGQVTEDERGSVGVPPPAALYCTKLGYKLEESTCTFPDGKSCEQWAFWRGECGTEHSHCAKNGGKLTREERNMGDYTAVLAVCELNGVKCEEQKFFETGKCTAE